MPRKKSTPADNAAIAGFFYEVGTLRTIIRSHRQVLLTNDLSDSIASHSFRVCVIGWFLAKMEKADANKVLTMCLFHDVNEARCNDHNWLHKRYVKVYEDEIHAEQMSGLPFDKEINTITQEYRKRESLESKVAKDADLLDQVLLLKEYEHTGNKEAARWLIGKRKGKRFFTASAKKLVKSIIDQAPSDWWKNLWTSKNR